MTEERVAFELHRQVAKAAHGQDHHHVTTVLTRAMWQVFLRAIGSPEIEPINPSSYKKLNDGFTLSFGQAANVAGSYTVVLDVPGMWAVSRLSI